MYILHRLPIANANLITSRRYEAISNAMGGLTLIIAEKHFCNLNFDEAILGIGEEASAQIRKRRIN